MFEGGPETLGEHLGEAKVFENFIRTVTIEPRKLGERNGVFPTTKVRGSKV